MKVILSRKGFDSSYGGFPSIILPKEMGRKMISFPIPEKGEREKDEKGKYTNKTKIGIEGIGAENIKFVLDDKSELTLAEIFSQLHFKEDKIKIAGEKQSFKNTIFHYDPAIQTIYDTDGNETRGLHGYAAFGQSKAAAGHLLNKGIKEGDIFLFFGTFKNTELREEKITYKREKEFHALWGYMVVDDVISVDNVDNEEGKKQFEKYKNKYPGLKDHPHFMNRNNKYEKSDKNIIICGKNFGTFNFKKNIHKLTRDGKSKSYWDIPESLDCLIGHEITYHKDKITTKHFKSASIGQEFVVKHNFNENEIKDLLNRLQNTLCTTSK
ncbi:MAG: hypothetical protein IKZ57_07095 [Spirochaetia bacterium]|nr:hypothetical protein [Spirochaetia bacterium]